MEGLLESFMKLGLVILAVFAIVAIAIYVASAIFLNKFCVLVENRRSAKAWIPVANLYLLGKLLKGKGLGWALVIAQIVVSILTGTTTVTVNGETTTSTIVGEPLGTIITSVWGVVCLGLFIWAIIKYIGVKRGGGVPRHESKRGDYLTKEVKQNPADNLWGWKDSDSSKM